MQKPYCIGKNGRGNLFALPMSGHTDTGFTMNTYMHVTDSMQENIANTMGNLLGGNVINS